MKRRSFLKTAAATALGIQIVPRHVLGGDGHTPPSEKLNLASIGVGGMGGGDIGSLAGGPINMVALCDVHEGNRNAAARRFPGAKTFADWRELLDQMDKQIDAVSVSTPDHMHAPISMSAIHRGKHVYCQKPLTHTIYEARQIAAAARKAKVVTQMGIQIHSSIEYRMATELIQAGAIGKIKEVHSWSDRPVVWPQGGSRPKGQSPVPKELNWDLWLGVAPQRPFVEGAYVPVAWRGFLDFGCGALGDMGCHIIDPPYTALKLTSPSQVWVEGPGCTDDMHPAWEIIHYEFPGTEYHRRQDAELDLVRRRSPARRVARALGQGPASARQRLDLHRRKGEHFAAARGRAAVVAAGGVPRLQASQAAGPQPLRAMGQRLPGQGQDLGQFRFRRPADRDGPAGRTGRPLPRQEAAVGRGQSQGDEPARGQPVSCDRPIARVGRLKAVG